jgi:hypothetical protein
MWFPPTQEIAIVGATLGFNEGSPIKTLQRANALHKHLENWMRLSNANTHLSSLENPKHVFNERALIGRLNSNLVKVVNPHRNASAKWTLDYEGLSIEPIVRAQVMRNHSQGL